MRPPFADIGKFLGWAVLIPQVCAPGLDVLPVLAQGSPTTPR